MSYRPGRWSALAAALFTMLLPIAPEAIAQSTGQGALAQPVETMAAPRLKARSPSRIWENETLPADQRNVGSPRFSADPAVLEIGRRLYEEGRRADGQALSGMRLDGQVRLEGPAAACALCHRRSGLGAVEGVERISPISGRYLFDQDRRAVTNQSIRGGRSLSIRHDPYDLASLGDVIRRGVHVSGRELAPLMPRYELSDAEVFALGSYLRRLSNAWSPGISEQTIRMATIIAPDVDAQRRRIFLDTLRAVVAQKNGSVAPGQRTMSSAGSLVLQTDRRWDLQVWELKGPPATWSAQLHNFQSENPVFAVLSGLGAGNWAPVHAFCESQRLPCWFPSVGAVPAERDQDFYSVYFSRGAGLEADVLADQWEAVDRKSPATGKLLQVYADDGVEETAVAALRERFGGRIFSLRLPASDGAHARTNLRRRLAELTVEDRVVFWLTPQQLEAVRGLPVPKAQVVFSASLGGGDHLPIDADWRAAARVIYPYQLPNLRQRGLTYFKEFLKVRRLQLEDEILQSEVFFATSYLNDILVDMLDNLHRDYLLERAESMLSLRELAKAEDEMRELSAARVHLPGATGAPNRTIGQRAYMPRDIPRSLTATETMPAMALATASPGGVGALSHAAMLRSAVMPGDGASGSGTAASIPLQVPVMAQQTVPAPSASDSRASGAPQSTNVYPRLSLGQQQRHASKGAYLVRFGNPGEAAINPLSEWIVP